MGDKEQWRFEQTWKQGYTTGQMSAQATELHRQQLAAMSHDGQGVMAAGAMAQSGTGGFPQSSFAGLGQALQGQVGHGELQMGPFGPARK